MQTGDTSIYTTLVKLSCPTNTPFGVKKICTLFALFTEILFHEKTTCAVLFAAVAALLQQ